jgi:hypothetical protein
MRPRDRNQRQLPPGLGPYPPHQQSYGQPYPPPAGYQQTTVATGGIPGWMHVLYAIGGFFTCGVLWVVWIIHWWFAQSKSRSTTVVTPTYHPPPQQPPYPPQ